MFSVTSGNLVQIHSCSHQESKILCVSVMEQEEEHLRIGCLIPFIMCFGGYLSFFLLIAAQPISGGFFSLRILCPKYQGKVGQILVCQEQTRSQAECLMLFEYRTAYFLTSYFATS